MIEEIKSQTKKYLQELESLVERNSPENLPFQLSALKDLSLFYLNCSSKIEDVTDNIHNKILSKEKTPLNKREEYHLRIQKGDEPRNEWKKIYLLAESLEDAVKKVREIYPEPEYHIATVGESWYD